MSQRSSGYVRQESDNYSTPNWVTRALLPHIPDRVKVIWEPAAGEGAMARVLGEHVSPRRGGGILATDIRPGNRMPTSDLSLDFLSEPPTMSSYQAIISNPPFNLAQEFIERALALTHRDRGFVAMLLRADFDHAKSRYHLFRNCDAFAKRLVLTRRIVWFVDPLTGRPKASPSVNHSWWIWDHQHRGAPEIAYYLEESGGLEDRKRIQDGEGAGRQDKAGPRQQSAPGETGCLNPIEG